MDPRSIHERGVVRLINSLAMTRWYRLGSLQVEWNAWHLVRNGFQGLVHFMWGERDWGFFDKLPMQRKPALCATFHACPDTLPEIVQNTRRLQNLAAVILMSEVQRPFFEACGVPSERIHVIHHGIDCRYFSPPPARIPGIFVVLFVGNYRRNFSLLHTVCAMLEPFPDIRIKIVAPKKKVELFKAHKNVITASDLDDDQLRSCYREASCLLLTLDAATANNAILESLACGLPIVAEDIGGVAEYTGARSAILSPPGSAQNLTDSILMLRNDHLLAARMGSFARERAEELDWPLVAKRTIGVYERVLASQACTASK
jgi:glycosyltransferase involved in cell wall biosynthesis